MGLPEAPASTVTCAAGKADWGVSCCACAFRLLSATGLTRKWMWRISQCLYISIVACSRCIWEASNVLVRHSVHDQAMQAEGCKAVHAV